MNGSLRSSRLNEAVLAAELVDKRADLVLIGFGGVNLFPVVFALIASDEMGELLAEKGHEDGE